MLIGFFFLGCAPELGRGGEREVWGQKRRLQGGREREGGEKVLNLAPEFKLKEITRGERR
jgi:hypothetical protein